MRSLAPRMLAVFLVFAALSAGVESEVGAEVAVVRLPPTGGVNASYISNRAPLAPSPLIKLPIGAIEPKGWLLSQLQLMRSGFTGRLQELSKFLKEDSGWITLKGAGWEEMPYWLKGYQDLGFLLRDAAIIASAGQWIDRAFRSQQADGYFGPAENRAKGDLWPNMLVLSCAQSLYEATGDARVIPFMTKYFRFEYNLPVARLLPGSWQKLRGGENLESVYWLYNRTGEAWLLDLARRLYERTADWESDVISPQKDKTWEASGFYHGVNISMGIRYPGVFFQQARDRKYLDIVEKNYRLLMDAYGQQPGGMFGADENIRPGHGDPRQGAETCSMVEFMNSDESLLKITGEGRYADRCEEIAFNSLPAAMTPDLKGLHYLTAPNLVSCDTSGEHDFQNPGTLLSYDPMSYRCCQHNVAFGWPYYAEHLWLATADNGLAAALYAPCEMKAKVGDGAAVRISEDSWYPFGDFIDFTVWAERDTRFPLYFRIPDWSEGARIFINGEKQTLEARPGHYAVVSRAWKNGDQVRLEFSPEIKVKVWPKLGNAVSVRRGPLWFSLKIGETWKRYGGTDDWPAYEVLPATPWNYGLDVDPIQPEASISVVVAGAPAYQPFELAAAPIVLKARAKPLPEWKAEGRMVGKIPSGPLRSSAAAEDVLLVPMGCARLRIAVFPRMLP
jgi:hypothetical protein